MQNQFNNSTDKLHIDCITLQPAFIGGYCYTQQHNTNYNDNIQQRTTAGYSLLQSIPE